ncbi:hypothetical protein BT96DRAFT_435136 [Gymnopus androsaceus JB14]|uniref:Uncharacterized protein n=1 Tax=Gymnopus androsaceus JB14 TaxID=1447944 RepID=A0A6A4GS22_9AGAR|nr:hypothetical protein BT96DRAFT_435136 [Gymnopus androsaceus JB14]
MSCRDYPTTCWGFSTVSNSHSIDRRGRSRQLCTDLPRFCLKGTFYSRCTRDRILSLAIFSFSTASLEEVFLLLYKARLTSKMILPTLKWRRRSQEPYCSIHSSTFSQGLQPVTTLRHTRSPPVLHIDFEVSAYYIQGTTPGYTAESPNVYASIGSPRD